MSPTVKFLSSRTETFRVELKIVEAGNLSLTDPNRTDSPPETNEIRFDDLMFFPFQNEVKNQRVDIFYSFFLPDLLSLGVRSRFRHK